eukprot:641969-Prymnesium_polylepis.1
MMHASRHFGGGDGFVGGVLELMPFQGMGWLPSRVAVSTPEPPSARAPAAREGRVKIGES